jgi:hypothetical protein
MIDSNSWCPSVYAGKYCDRSKAHQHRPEQALMTLEVEAARISELLATEGEKIVSPAYRVAPYPPGDIRGTHFC